MEVLEGKELERAVLSVLSVDCSFDKVLFSSTRATFLSARSRRRRLMKAVILRLCQRAVELSGCFNEVLFLPEDKGSVALRVLWIYSSHSNDRETL